MRYSLMGTLAVLMVSAAIAQSVTGPSEPVPAHASASQTLTVATEPGFGIFQRVCLSCHGKPEYKEAPSPATLRSYTPERLYQALTTGPMKAVGDSLTDVERRLVAQAIAGRLLGTSSQGDAEHMAHRCSGNEPLAPPDRQPQWWSWGNSERNTRFQPEPGLSAAHVADLKLKWAFGLPNSTSVYSQPTVASGRVFIGSDTGYVYSLDARSGCVYWSYPAESAVRSAPMVEPFHGYPKVPYAVYFGDLKANVYALDAQTGKLLWKQQVDSQYTTRVTATPAFYDDRLYVPVSSWEEYSARSLDYPCCTAVGNIVALDARNGRRVWKTYVIAKRPRPVRKNSLGVLQYAPAGGSVWNTPAVDSQRQAIYFGTGDATTAPAADTSDAVMALDMRTGRRLWSYQVVRNDAFLVGCRGDGVTENCPPSEGPDWDIPASVILATLPHNQRLIIVGTKPGDVLALDPDQGGRLAWRMNVSGPLAGDTLPPNGDRPTGIMWGGTVVDGTVYYGLTGGGMIAIDLMSGKPAWKSSLGRPDRTISDGSPATGMPGAVFIGGADGRLLAVAPNDGQILWRFESSRDYDTVNGIAAHGGGFSSQGIALAGGWVFAGSGYAVTSAHPGNALLAFGPE